MHLPALLVAAALVLVSGTAYALNRIAAQAGALDELRSAAGEVVASKAGDGGRPRVAYEVGSQRYETTRLAPLASVQHGADAESLRRRWRRGAEPTVWFPAGEPAAGFLLREPRFWPYGIVLGATAFAAGLLAVLRMGGVFEARPSATPRGRYGWSALASGPGPGAVAAAAAIAAAAWYFVLLVAVGHYTLGIGGSLRIAAAVGIPFALVGLWPVGIAWTRGRAAVPMTPPRVTAMQPDVRLDLPVIVRVECTANRRAALRSLNVSLCCARRTGLSSLSLFRTTRTLDTPPALEPPQRVFEEVEFEVPQRKRRDASPFSRWCYPRTDWYVEVAAAFADAGTARYRFTLQAVAAPDPSASSPDAADGDA